MEYAAQKNTLVRRAGVLWGALGVVGIIGGLLVVSYLTATSLYRAALYGADAPQRLFRPLVRHQISQKHCYDDGSRFCEERSPTPFTKEFTIGYLSHSEPPSSAVIPLFSCVDERTQRYVIAAGREERRQLCRGVSHTHRLGFLFQKDILEAATPLYRCVNAVSADFLLTDGPSECDAVAGYRTPQLLGYMGGAGYLPQRKLNEFCDVVGARCGPGSTDPALCAAQKAFCTGPR